MNIDGKKCLVTGGAGFIGSHLVDALMGKGCYVRMIDNLSNGKIENISHHFNSKNFEFLRGSVADPGDVRRAVEGIDIVFHLACLGVRHSIAHPYENHRVNAEGTLLMLDASFSAGIKKFLYCSSSEVYGTAQFVPMTESHPTMPCTVYGASKLVGEAYARAYYKTYGMQTLMIRPFNTFGPRSHHEGDAGEVIPKFIIRALNKKPILVFGNGSQTRDFTFVEDMAKAILAVAESDNMIGKTVNIGSGAEITIRELAVKISEAINGSTERIEFTSERPGDVNRLLADTQYVLKICNWKPEVNFEEGLLRTINYFRQHPLGLRGLMKDEIARNWEK